MLNLFKEQGPQDAHNYMHGLLYAILAKCILIPLS